MQQNRIPNRKFFWLTFIEIFKSFEKRIFRYVEYHRFCDGKPLSFQHHKIYCNKNIKEYLNCSATFFNDFFIIVLAIFFYKRRQRKSKQRNPRHQQRNDSVMKSICATQFTYKTELGNREHRNCSKLSKLFSWII